MSALQAIDPITLSVLQNGLQQVCNEMDLAFVRSAFSPVIAEALDLTVQQLFPERFAVTGERIHHTRQQHRSTRRAAANVQNGEAA